MRAAPLLLLLASCSAPRPEAAPTPDVVVRGAESLSNGLMDLLARDYMRAHPDVLIDVAGQGEHEGFRAMLDGSADLVASERLATPAEDEQARVNGYTLRGAGHRAIIAVDVVTLQLHPSQGLDALTYDQVIGIFCTAELNDWSMLGLEPGPIHALVQPPGTGARALFEDFFCGPRGVYPRWQVVGVEQAAELLRADPNAIAFTTLTQVSGRVLALRPEVGGAAAAPTQQSVIRGGYPLYQDVYLYNSPDSSPEALAFAEWVRSPAGQEVVDEARYVPLFLRPASLDGPRPLRETVNFEQGGVRPNQRSAARMAQLIDELHERLGQTRNIVLEGFADSREEDGLALSLQRAEAVRDELAAALPGINFELIPRGADRPIAPNTTPYGRQRNRRVQIYLSDEEAEGGLVVEPPPSE